MIPVNEPLLGEKELEYVTDCVTTGWISSAGEYIDKFEEQWAAYCGRRYGVAVSNGTVALQAAVACLDLQPGDEVIMPSFTIISCAMAVVYNGGVPVLVDSDPDTWCMDVAQIEAKITPRTRAIMPVHIYGHPVDMDPLLALAEKHGLVVIEDAAEAHGAEYKGRKAGAFGLLSCFSFYANKIITTGEGGMIVTDDPALAERARSLRNLCFQPQKRFYHTELGHNFRMTNLQAALGVAQIEQVDEFIEIKRRNAGLYSAGLADIGGIQLPVERPNVKNVYWMYGIVLDDGLNLDGPGLAAKLAEAGIGTRPFFLGMHEQPVFHDMGLFSGERYPVAERIARQGLYLPSGLTLTEKPINIVCSGIKELVGAR